MLRSVSSPRVKKLRRAFLYQDWEKREAFGIRSERLVRQAVNAGIVTELLYVSDCPIPFDKKTRVTPEVMSFLTRGKEENLAAVCRKWGPRIPAGGMHRILMLDRVSYRTNIGRILYLAYSFGVDVVYVSEGDGINYHAQGIVESSQGTSFFLPVIPASLPERLRELREQGWYCVGTSLHNAVPLSGIPSADKMVFVLGNEHDGVSGEVLKETDVSCRIEMENYDSLNVAVAAGILLHRFRR